MPMIRLETVIDAPITIVFDLARDIDFHKHSMTNTQEKAVAGTTQGLIGMDEWVTWEAVHFGVRQRLTSKITAYDRPVFFKDTMQNGAFKRFDHEHIFSTLADGKTLMEDVFDYDSPLGWLGKIADVLFLEQYLCHLLLSRNTLLKTLAEGHLN